MKVLVILVSSIEDEPRLIDSFIAGYESVGGVWTGTLEYIENQNIVNLVPELIESDYNLFIYNSSAYATAPMRELYGNGEKLFLCGNGNQRYQQSFTTLEDRRMIIACGAGKYENTTSYEVEFTDIDPYASRPISTITQDSGGNVAIGTPLGDPFISPSNFYYFISGVTGFANNPEGGYLEQDFFHGGDSSRVDISHNLGGGAYAGGGILEAHFQSYSTPYIAGKLAYIKDTLGCTWWEARYRARITASENGIFDIYNGYGIIDVNKAIGYSGTIIPDPYLQIGQPHTLQLLSAERKSSHKLYLTFYCEVIDNAYSYQLLKNSVVVQTIGMGRIFTDTLDINTDDLSATSYQYRGAFIGSFTLYGELSSPLVLKNIKHKYLITTNDDINS